MVDMAAPPSAPECFITGPPSVNQSDVDVKQNVGNINITIAGPAPAAQPQTAQLQQQAPPQPQPVYAAQPVFVGQPANQVITTQPQAVYSNNLGPMPALTVCRNCGRRVNTTVLYKNGSFTILMCFVLTLVGCCCIPFCVDCFKDAHHSCPECHMNLHVHKRM